MAKCLASIPRRHWKHTDIIEVLSDLFIMKGVPDYIRSDNGSEFTANKLLEWMQSMGVRTVFIEPGSPWENGYCESFNGKIRDGFLNRELFDTMFEVEALTKLWVQEYNTVRPHSSLGYKPPAPQMILTAA